MKNQNLLKTIKQGATSFIMIVALFAFSQESVLGQNVGIGTLSPHTSAALHIQSNNKGVLFPAVPIQGSFDDTTIPVPAPNLFVFNTNASFSSGRGFYYNAGTAGSPNWTSISQLKLPYYGYLSASGSATNALEIQSDQNKPNSAAIRAAGAGVTTGISTYSGTGLALDVHGRIQISGNSQTPAAGKVLTSDANGNATWQGAVAFSATGVVGGGSQKLASNVLSRIPFETINYDLGGNYQGSNGNPHSTFTAPVNGIYHFDAQITWLGQSQGGDNVSSTLILRRTRNNAVSDIGKNFNRSFDNDQTIMISVDCQLQQGDEINVVAINQGSDYRNIWTSEKAGTFFNGRLVIKN